MNENESLVRRFFEEVWSAGRLETVDELVAPGHRHHISGGTVDGPGGVKDLVTWLRAAFPDLSMTVEEAINAEDTVVVRWTGRGTYAGADVPAARGRRVEYTGIDIVRVRGGQIIELWGNNDSQGLWEQLDA
jgi:predicted ester cyclase